MEQHGKIPTQNVIAIIPARFSSTRLEGKLLLPLNGKPLILHTLEQTKKAKNISRVIVATDDEQILKAVEKTDNEAVLTSKDHKSGSDRIAEVAEKLSENSIIVNVQGDEPLISPKTIEKAVEAILHNETVDISTTCERISDYKDVLNPDIVKVVTDKKGFALYFSRSPIPYPRDEANKFGSLEKTLQKNKNLLNLYRKHTGLYVYRREFLLKYTNDKQTHLEKTEMLEQLRALESGAKIKVVEVDESSIGVDTKEDFEKVERIIKSQNETATKFVYREAVMDDVPKIAQVHVSSWRDSYKEIIPKNYLESLSVKKREDVFRKILSDGNYKLLVATTSKNKIIGFVDCGKARNKKYGFDAEIYAIYLLKEYQRNGIGSQLFIACIKELIKTGYKSIYLETLEASPYKEFYEKLKGEVVGKDIHKIADENYTTLIYGWDDLTKI